MKKRNRMALIGIVMLLALGYTIPIVAMAVDDEGLLKETKSVQLDSIELNVQGMEFAELLEVFSFVLANNIVVESDVVVETYKEEVQESTDLLNSTEASAMIKLSIKTFLDVFGISEVEFVDFKATHYVMMLGPEDERVCSVWKCYGMDELKQEYLFWIEEGNGKVLAFEMPFVYVGKEYEMFFQSMDALARYYAFEGFKLWEDFSEAYKFKSWESDIMFFDKEGNGELNIRIYKNGEKLYFNMYPKLYDSFESITD